MSGQLASFGIISHFAGAVGERLVAANLSWPVVFGLLNAAYFALHYMFASQTAHVGALYAAFLGMMQVAGVPAVLGALSLGFMSNLFGSITHFGSGQAAVYYGAGVWDWWGGPGERLTGLCCGAGAQLLELESILMGT